MACTHQRLEVFTSLNHIHQREDGKEDGQHFTSVLEIAIRCAGCGDFFAFDGLPNKGDPVVDPMTFQQGALATLPLVSPSLRRLRGEDPSKSPRFATGDAPMPWS